MEHFRNKLEEKMLNELDKLDDYDVGTEERKDVLKALETLFRIENEDFKTQLQEADAYDRQVRRDLEEKAKKELTKKERFMKWVPKPDTMVNAGTLIFLTLMVMRFEKEGNILPAKLLKYVDKIKLV